MSERKWLVSKYETDFNLLNNIINTEIVANLFSYIVHRM